MAVAAGLGAGSFLRPFWASNDVAGAPNALGDGSERAQQRPSRPDPPGPLDLRPDQQEADEQSTQADAADSSGDDELRSTAAVVVAVLCRDAVGLASTRATSRSHAINRLTLHHSGVVLDAVASAPGRLRGHQGYHQSQGWPDIAYHYAVDLAGNVYELRDPSIPGDTFTRYDPQGHLLIVCEGSFSRQQPTDQMLDAVTHLVAAAASEYGVSVHTLAGHRDYVATDCPGDALYRTLGDITSGAAALLADPPVLQSLCGPQAVDLVAAIERS